MYGRFLHKERHGVRRCQTHIHEIDIHTKYEIEHIVWQFIHEVEHGCLRSLRCDMRKLLLRERPRDLRGQNEAYIGDTAQHITQEEHQVLCRFRRTRTYNAERRCPRIKKGRAVHILENRTKRCIAPWQNLCPFDPRKHVGKPLGAVRSKGDYMRRGMLRQNRTNVVRRCTKREIDEQIDPIPANHLCCLLRCHRADLAQCGFLCKRLRISALTRMIGIDLIPLFIVCRKVHWQQIPHPSRPEVRGEIAEPNLSRGFFRFSAVPCFMLLFLHRLSSSVRCSTSSYACSNAFI